MHKDDEPLGAFAPSGAKSPPPEAIEDTGIIRQFGTGAIRDTSQEKHQYEGFLSPLVTRRYGEFMHKHRKQSDGSLRAADNWQKGIPLAVYMDSLWRHFLDAWAAHRGWWYPPDGIEEALCAILFNASGYLHELLRKRRAYNEDQR